MGDGIKSMWEDAQESAWQDQLRRLGSWDHAEVLRILINITQEVDWLHKSDVSLTRTQHCRLDDIRSMLHRLLRGKES